MENPYGLQVQAAAHYGSEATIHFTTYPQRILTIAQAQDLSNQLAVLVKQAKALEKAKK